MDISAALFLLAGIGIVSDDSYGFFVYVIFEYEVFFICYCGNLDNDYFKL